MHVKVALSKTNPAGQVMQALVLASQTVGAAHLMQ